MLTTRAIWEIEDNYSHFFLGKNKDFYFLYAWRTDIQMYVQLFPYDPIDFVESAPFHLTINDTFSEISLDDVCKILDFEYGHYKDFELALIENKKTILATEVNHNMRVIICGFLKTSKSCGPIDAKVVRKLTGYNVKQFEDGWGARSYTFLDIYNDYYEIENYKVEYLPFAVSYDEKDSLFKILKKDGFKIFHVLEGYVALVNLDLKRASTAQKPCKHACVNDRIYSYKYFMKKYYLPWKENTKEYKEV